MLAAGEIEDQHMDNESTTVAAAPAATAAPAAAKAAPAPVPHRLDEVVRQVKAQLVGQERRRGANPYDSLLGRPSHDVWGIRKRA
jgi:hypothetical protein